MDSVSIRRADGFGRVVAFDNFVGLFTSKAYAEEAQHIPVLRAKLREVLDSEGAAPGSHDYKEIVSTFNSFPKDELFRAPVAELRAQLRLILDVKSQAAVRLFVAPDLRHGNVIALVVMPRDAGSADLSRRIQDTLAAALHGVLVYFYLALGEGYTARLHFCFVADPPKVAVIRGLEKTIAELARRWDDRLQERLIEKFGPKRGHALADRWTGAFSADYQAAVDVARAVGDIEDVETLIASGRDFVVEAGPRAHESQLDEVRNDIRILGLGDAPMLSDLMPTLQNFAVQVLSEDAHELHPRTDGKVTRAYLQVFSVQGPGDQQFAKFPGAGLMAEAIIAVREGLASDDALNALALDRGPVVARGRAAARISRRGVSDAPRPRAPRPAARPADESGVWPGRFSICSPLDSRSTIPRRQTKLPSCARRIWRAWARSTTSSTIEPHARSCRWSRRPCAPIFSARRRRPIHTSRSSSRARELPGCLTPRRFTKFTSTVRAWKDAICAHGRLARGGIRFSDRPDDYRTEILDLMKTQTVKNAIIVPTRRQGRLRRQAAPAPSARSSRWRRSLQDADQRDARSYRQPHRRRPGASAAGQGTRR